MVVAESAGQSIAGFSALGERRVPAEEIGRLAARAARSWLRGVGALDEHAGDQVLLPMGLAASGLLGPARTTSFLAHELSDHLTTHARVLEAFLPIRVTIDSNLVTVSPR
jgi:RNA 3'-terminal phosphate cyclase (ATP)